MTNTTSTETREERIARFAAMGREERKAQARRNTAKLLGLGTERIESASAASANAARFLGEWDPAPAGEPGPFDCEAGCRSCLR
jgi:hypothetical protein